VADRASQPTQAEKAARFRALHEGEPFVMPNPWDAGSARALEALGFEALATTSAGFALTPDVLYAPRLSEPDQIRAVCEAVEKPVNVLARPNFSMDELASMGARRVSVGGNLAWVANEAMFAAAKRIRESGDFSALKVSRHAGEWLGD
jgi:2-methylisocitrate lyase-like PEP mutase family enzyme